MFLTYASSVYTNNFSVDMPLINLAISTWVGSIFITTASAITAFSLVSRLKVKK
jgi:hypothetical protein